MRRFCKRCWRDDSDGIQWPTNRHTRNWPNICLECYRSHMNAWRRRRYRKNEKHREARRKQARAYYAANAAKERERKRRYYWTKGKLRLCGVVPCIKESPSVDCP